MPISDWAWLNNQHKPNQPTTKWLRNMVQWILWVPNQHFKCSLPCNCTAACTECGLGKWGSYPQLRVYWWTHHWGIERPEWSSGRLRVSNIGTEPFHPNMNQFSLSLSVSFFSNMRPVHWWRWDYPAIRHQGSFATPAEQCTADLLKMESSTKQQD